MAKYTFSDIAHNLTEKRIPEPEDMQTYVGLEHMDSGSLTIKRFGSSVPIKGQKLVMKKGDLLFGRRNTYLKRAAIAPHDGLFSAHGMIFRPKEDVINKAFLPFFIASDYFMDKAIQISVGSLSPTVNWGSLKDVEIEIPPIEKQEELAALLWAANDARESYQKLIELTDELVKAQFIEMFGDPRRNTKNWQVKRLPEVSENLDKHRVPITSGSRVKGEYPYYGASGVVDFVDNYIFDEDLLLVSEDGANLLARVTPIAFSTSGKIWVNNHAHVLKFRYLSTQMYVEHLIKYLDISSYVIGSAQPKLSQANLNRIPIPFPPKDLMIRFQQFVQQTRIFKINIKNAYSALDDSKTTILQNSII